VEAFLYSLPPLVLLVGAIAVSVLFACGGQILVHRRFPSVDFVRHNEVGGFIIAIVGTLYAVLLGFLTTVVWQHFTQEQAGASQEASAAADVWHTSVGLPYVVRNHIRSELQTYARIMINDEWPAMRHGGYSTNADIVMMDAMGADGSYVPVDEREANSQLTTQQELSVMHDQRLLRLSDNKPAVSSFEWVVLILGAVCVISFCWLFGLSNPRVHLLMTATVAIVITSVLVLLFELQYPFRSSIGIPPDCWSAFTDHIQLMQKAGQADMKM